MRRKKETRDFFKPIQNKTKRNNNEKEENIVEQEYIQKLLIWIFANGHEREDKEKVGNFASFRVIPRAKPTEWTREL